MLRHFAFLPVILTLAACATGSGPAANKPVEPEAIEATDKVEREALSRIGDVRVYYYQKEGNKPSAVRPGTTVKQPKQLHVLVNKGHSFYVGMQDFEMPEEQRYLTSADMHDLLVILRDQMGFFERGNSINIKGDDPIKRADSEPKTDRIIAVEQIKDGKINTSYFARRILEEALDEKRSKVFNDSQSIVLDAVANALPRGRIGEGAGDRNDILPGRRE
jgi:hypothetical protein